MAVPPVSAIDIASTPFSQLVTAADFNAGTFSDGVANEVWFKFVSGDDQVFAVKTTDPFTGPRVPIVSIRASDGTTVLRSASGANRGLGAQITNGATYYVKIVRDSGGGAADTNFTVTADVLGYLTSVPDNAGIINDDTDGFPAIVFTIDGTYLGYLPDTIIPAGEMAAVLPNGISIWHDRFAASNQIKLVARDLTTIAAFDIPGISGTGAFPRFTNSDTDFYVSDAALPSKIYKITDAGVVTQVATLTGDRGYVICANSDGTILYYIEVASDDTIHKWDLVNDVTLGDLVTIPALLTISFRLAQTPNSHPGDILYLSNDKIVTWYRDITNSLDHIIVISASTGVIIADFTLDSDLEVDHLSYNADSPASIRVWTYSVSVGSTGVIGDYSVITGTFSSSFNSEYYSELLSGATDGQLFGPSSSCTMITLLSGAAATASLTIVKVTNPSPDETDTDFPFNATAPLSPPTFSLKNGESQVYSNIDPGTYGIAEIVPAGWSVSYSVSNGNPPNAIEIEEGESVSVTVTNTRVGPPGPIIVPTNTGSGLYRIVKDKRQDTLWDSYSPKRTKNVKIPDPFIKTGLIGK